MKNYIFVLFVFFLNACGTQKKTSFRGENKCKVVVVSPEDLTSNYKAFYSYSEFNINQFADFDKLKNGILMYRWQEGAGASNFLIVDIDKGFSASRKGENFNMVKTLSLKEKNDLKTFLEI